MMLISLLLIAVCILLYLIRKTLLEMYEVLAGIYLYKTWDGEFAEREKQMQRAQDALAKKSIFPPHLPFPSVETLKGNRLGVRMAFADLIAEDAQTKREMTEREHES